SGSGVRPTPTSSARMGSGRRRRPGSSPASIPARTAFRSKKCRSTAHIAVSLQFFARGSALRSGRGDEPPGLALEAGVDEHLLGVVAEHRLAVEPLDPAPL